MLVKRTHCSLAFCLFVLSVWGGITHASGVITFQVEVIPGFTISAPDSLLFPPVAPDQISQQELTLRVWSNVQWNLSIRATGEEVEGSLFGTIEAQGEDGVWYGFFGGNRTLRSSQAPTGIAGKELNIPFRFEGNYKDTPGVYSFAVEFTVVPAL